MTQIESQQNTFKEISDQAKAVVGRIKHIIAEGSVGKKGEASSGWELSSKELDQEIRTLSNELSINGYTVYNCKVCHLVRGGIIQNRTGHQIIILLNRNATFLPKKPLLSFHYTTQIERLLGDNVDLIIMSLRKSETC
ncbi:hypothetical protein ASPZODRAFT_126717 [Penicilliopsis zonata CBS 506.65]|uniref:Uncharacterized protein n=1 Tax=Penicilliopsis zonata CBS 506.65 TaxID=1073090 RepID=A0A1L9SUB3_9EURO|nr:hypothetical protein ASPZODRAFT_126717 [Penicilliopsis zonata CBS 506.65]OJJ50779.1 hypothetical protein ASPZODRAFT_126717 [Penicilliopsis zonata CBS 506.65]